MLRRHLVPSKNTCLERNETVALTVFPQIMVCRTGRDIRADQRAVCVHVFFMIIILMSITAIASKLNEESKRLIQSVALPEKRVRELEDDRSEEV